jgi:uncharacterized membrane protein YkvI
MTHLNDPLQPTPQEKQIMAILSLFFSVFVYAILFSVASIPFVAAGRGIHDQLRWNVSWWKRPVIVVCQLSMLQGLAAIHRAIELAWNISPIISLVQATITTAILYLLYRAFKTSYFDRAKRIKVWWKLATRKKRDEIPLEHSQEG